MLDFEISPADAAALLREHKARLIDVREPWEFATARIEGSVAMPMSDVPGRANQELDPDEHLVVVCHHQVLDECDCVATQSGVRESAVAARGN